MLFETGGPKTGSAWARISQMPKCASKPKRVEDQIDGANVTQATVAFGVSTDKIILLLGELGGGVPLQVNL